MGTIEEKYRYKYLFPYEKVPYRSKIVIYGAGILGQDYYLQLHITGYCEVIGFIDRNYMNYCNSIVPVYSPQDIGGLDFDYVVVALRTQSQFNDVKRRLRDAGIPDEIIIAVFERQVDTTGIMGTHQLIVANDESSRFAFEVCPKSIALLTTGGYGDGVVQKKLITEIVKLVPNSAIDIYNTETVDFLRTLYTDTPNIRNIIPDLGSRYLKNKRKYKLSLTISACHFIRVDFFDEDFWKENDAAFFKRMTLLQKTQEEVTLSTPTYVTFYRRWLKGYNMYTGFSYDGVFDIVDKKVNIPLDEAAGARFKQIRESWKAHNYITLNCGNGACGDSALVAKSWPSNYFDELALRIADDYPDVYIVQLGDNEARKIRGCNEYFFGCDFSLVEWVLKNSALHIDIEGGLVHIASQLGVKCVVLFGPTMKEYVGYENNINISAGNCHNCWGLYSDVNKCARDMKEPECMYSISPDLVYEHVKKELDRKAFFSQINNR